jgi:hypothetical protein
MLQTCCSWLPDPFLFLGYFILHHPTFQRTRNPPFPAVELTQRSADYERQHMGAGGPYAPCRAIGPIYVARDGRICGPARGPLCYLKAMRILVSSRGQRDRRQDPPDRDDREYLLWLTILSKKSLDYILMYKKEAVIFFSRWNWWLRICGVRMERTGSQGVMTFHVKDSVSLIGGGF